MIGCRPKQRNRRVWLDQLTFVAWFILFAGSWCGGATEIRPLVLGALENAATANEVGMLDVTRFPGVDPTGETDSTTGVLQAVVAARDANRALFFPVGVYLVSDTVLGVQHSPGRCGSHRGIGTVQLIGSTAGPNRPLIRLADASPAFGDATTPRPVVEIRCMVDDGARESPPCGFRHGFRGIDIDVGHGNPGAVGIRFHAAQDSFLEDVTVDARDGFAGITGLPGRSMVSANLEVRGGRYGLYLNNTSLGSVLAGVKLSGQRELALWTNATRALTVTGLSIEEAHGPVIHLEGRNGDQGHLALRDACIDIAAGEGPLIDNATGRLVALHDVYVRGAGSVLTGGEPLAGGGGWQHIERFIHTPPEAGAGMPGITALPAGEPAVVISEAMPPADLVSRHLWHETPSFETPGTIIVTRPPRNAQPDDEMDDTAAIQAALDENGGTARVYLPAGTYVLSKPLRLHAGNTLMGVPGLRSVLKPAADWPQDHASWMIETDDASDATAVLMDIALDVPDGAVIGGVHWRLGGGAIVRRVRTFLSAARIEGPGQVYRIEGHGGGRWYGVGDHMNERGYPEHPSHPDFRKFLVTGTTSPLTFYGLNVERGGVWKPDRPQAPFVEIRDAANILVLGSKMESEGTAFRLENVSHSGLSLILANPNPDPGRRDPLIEFLGECNDVEIDGVIWPGSDAPLMRVDGKVVATRRQFIGVWRSPSFP